MCNSSDSQSMFLSILDFVNNKIDFDLKNHEIIVEAFAITHKQAFVLLITRIPKPFYLHTSKSKHSKLKFTKSLWINFAQLEDFCMFCNSLENNLKIQSSLYFLDNYYFLHIKLNNLKDYFKYSALASEFSNSIYNNNFILDENSTIIIQNSAIEMCKKYFV